ncbi:phage tail tape measure protein [Thermoactinomyces sp. DSM 45892]|uniref:phage tail tape measure protein n=1 Tax=Thermoactinomyces sp. DSM 45892 TaxID=1882753 RepID=UPI000897980B|nr:phage tail tape measure protein [Thermoactinomyces sp. DSM 45892]SDY69621.1 phage tail tape measure protein, TP901 family, core region [Thermoactinomyces sp. DSM 45892]
MDQVLGRLRGEITLESEGFKRGMNEVNTRLRLAKSEFDSSSARIKAFGKSQDDLQLQAQALNRQLDLQEKKVELLAQKHTTALATTGEYSKETQQAATKLNRATIAQTELEGALNRVSKAMQGASEPTRKLQRDIFAVRDEAIEAGVALGVMSAALAVAFGSTVVKAANFEAQLSSLKAVTNASAEDMEKLKDQALLMGQQTKYSAQEAAQGQEELAKAGLSTSQILSGGLKGALDLAAAGELELAEAAEIASTALNTFQRDNLSVTRAADILAGSAISSATNVNEMKFALSQVSTVAAGAGLTFEDTATALATFAMNGLKGSDAGTSLKTMLLALKPTAKEAIAEMKRLGIITGEVNHFFEGGKIKSFAEVAELLKTKLSKLSDEQRNLALKTLFGTDAIRAANIAFLAGADGVQRMNKELNKTTASDVAKTRMDNLKGTVEELKGSFETLQISIGSAFLPVLRNLAKGLNSVVDWFSQLSPSTQEALGIFTATTSVVLGLGAAVAGVIAVSNPFIGAIVGGAVAIGAITSAVVKVQKDLEETKQNALQFGIGVSEGTAKAAKGYVDLRDQAMMNLTQLRNSSGTEAQKIVTETVAIFTQMGDKVSAALNQDKLNIQKATASLLGEVPEVLKPVVSKIGDDAVKSIDEQINKIKQANTVIDEGITKLGGNVAKMPQEFATKFNEALKQMDQSAQVFVKKTGDIANFTSQIEQSTGKLSDTAAMKFRTSIESAYSGAIKAAQEGSKELTAIYQKSFDSGQITEAQFNTAVQSVKQVELQKIAAANEARQQGLDALRANLDQEKSIVDLKTGEIIESTTRIGREATSRSMEERNRIAQEKNATFFNQVTQDAANASTAVNNHFSSMVTQLGLTTAQIKIDLSPAGMGAATTLANGLRSGKLSVDSVAAQLGLNIKSGVQVDLGSQGKFTVSTLISGLQSGKIGLATFVNSVDKLLKSGANVPLSPEGRRTISSFQSGLSSGTPVVSSASKSLQDIVRRNLTFSASGIGSNISSSMASGISSGRSSVISSAISIARSALSSMKRVLGINSPSREFMKLGGWTSEGFAMGMEKKASLVGNAASLLSSVAVPNVANLTHASSRNKPPVTNSTIQNHFVINSPIVREEQDIYKLVAEIERVQAIKQRAKGVVNIAY